MGAPLATNASADRAADRGATVDELAVPPGPAWIRPAAMVLFVLGVVGALAMLLWQTRAYGSVARFTNSPPMAMAIMFALIAVMALAVVVLRPERGELHALSVTSAVWSLALVVALVFAWAAISSTDRQDHWHGMFQSGLAETDSYLAAHVPSSIAPIRIPTGVLIKSLEFLDGDNVSVSGFVWQRYGPDVPEDLDRGVVLAEEVNNYYELKEAYRYEEDGVETIGWFFSAKLRQPFGYAQFPFDEQDVWLRMWPRDFSEDIVLVPDYASYTSMTPGSLPGIEHEFVYSGWTPLYSGFSYSDQPYDTSFGIGRAGQYADLPDLYFNFVLDREFAGPFFEHVIFAIAVAFLLFGLLVLTTDDEQMKARFQLSTSGVLGAASGLLFAVILKHNQLRSGVAGKSLSYIEVLPIILYGAIVVVVLNAILVAAPVNMKLVKHRNNLWPVLAYWPVMLAVLLIVTLAVFFRP